PQTVFRDGYETSLTGRMLLLSPAVWNGVSTAGTARDMARRQLTVTVNTTIHETVAAFIDLLRLATLTELQERHLEQARENEALARRLFEVGRYSEADVLRWNVEVAQRNSELYEQRRGVRMAALALENLMNVEPRGTTRPAPGLPPRLRDEIDRFRNMSDESWERFLARSLEDVVAGNPQLLVLEATERLAELDHRGSLTNFLPSVVVSGSYGWQNNDTVELDGEKAWSVTAALSMPVFTSLDNFSERQRTKARLRETRAGVADGRRQLLLSAEAARSAILSSTAQLDLAEAGLASARRSYEIQDNRYRLGRLSNLEWVDANLALQDAEQRRTSAYYDLVLAIADYYQSRGEMTSLLRSGSGEEGR
ncbi:MAG: hypothetical protein GF355_02895, partial [Candidatus Eisenbacteria bacterium]|nr:hypothetical protein [Candidatus Eisenbacteria bacterium]